MTTVILWGITILFYGIGDVVSTRLAVQYENVEEAAPVTRKLIGANPTLTALLKPSEPDKYRVLCTEDGCSTVPLLFHYNCADSDNH